MTGDALIGALVVGAYVFAAFVVSVVKARRDDYAARRRAFSGSQSVLSSSFHGMKWGER